MAAQKATIIMSLAVTILFCMGFCFYVANASDSSPLQDICVAATDDHFPSNVLYHHWYMNGKMCKDPKKVRVEDFIYKGFNKSGKITTRQRAKATLIDVDKFPGLNTLGVTIGRIDFDPLGLNTLHWHQRSSEVFAVMKGRLYAGFVTQDNKLFTKELNEGDVIVFPQALVHFQYNPDRLNPAYAIAAFGSQNPGRVDVANTVFGTHPRIDDDVLVKGFQVIRQDIERLRFQFELLHADDENYTTDEKSSIVDEL